MKTHLFSLSAFLMLILALPVQAAPITFNFSGSVESIGTFNELDSSVAVGTALTGSYTFESTISNSSGSPHKNTYKEDTYLMQASFGNYTLQGHFRTEVYNNFGGFDRYESWISGGTSPDNYLTNGIDSYQGGNGAGQMGSFLVNLLDNSATALSTQDLLLSPPDVTDYNIAKAQLTMRDGTGNLFGIQFKLDSIELAGGTVPVPAPASVFLFAIALCGFLTRHSRVRNRQV